METDGGDPVVSVIVPCFNAAAYIRPCLDTLLAQSMPDLEIVVVDDRSTDDTVELVTSYTDERVRLVQMETNQGPGAARNRGMEMSRGRWITPVDADDLCHPRRLELLLAEGQRRRAPFVLSDRVLPFVVDAELERGDEEPRSEAGGYVIQSASEWLLGPRTARPFIDRQMWEETGVRYPATKSAEDTVFLALLAGRAGAQIVTTPHVTYFKREVAGSLGSRSLERLAGRCQSYGLLVDGAPPDLRPATLTLLRRAQSDLWVTEMVAALRSRRVGRVRKAWAGERHWLAVGRVLGAMAASKLPRMSRL